MGEFNAVENRYRVCESAPVVLFQAAKQPEAGLFGGQLGPTARCSRAALYAVHDGRTRVHEVEVLARNGSEAWIRSELAPGTELILFPPSSLQDGARVRKLAGG